MLNYTKTSKKNFRYYSRDYFKFDPNSDSADNICDNVKINVGRLNFFF